MQNINDMLSDLSKRTMSVYELDEKIKNDTFAPEPSGFFDSFQFENENPGHPLCETEKSERMMLADQIFKIVSKNPDAINDVQLKIIHKIVFDCCAAIRLAIVEAIGLIGRKESIVILEKILQDGICTRNTKSVKMASIEAIKVIKGELKVDEGHYIRKEQVYC